ncbi:MAG: prepilin peptidase [Caulobacterales bacterium]
MSAHRYWKAMLVTIVGTALLAALLIGVCIVDVRHQRIPDVLNLAIGAAGLGTAVLLDEQIWLRGLAIVGGYGALWGVNAVYRGARGLDGVGMGDAKLLAAGGAWVGVMGLPFVLVLAASLALVGVAGARIAGRSISLKDRIPFGPFLAAGILVVWAILSFGPR